MTDAIVPVSYQLAKRDPKAFVKHFAGSFERYGFAVICDHELPQALIDGCLSRFKQFFALPEEEKLRYRIPGIGGARGLTPFGVETAKGATHYDLKEFWQIGRELPPGHRYRSSMPDNIWIPGDPGFKRAALDLWEAFDQMGRKLLEAIAVYLGLPQHWFDDKVGEGNSVLRVIHYPPLKEGSTGVRAGAHEDINVITLLLGAEEGGLEVQDRNGCWLAINPPPGMLVCNVGDMLQRSTNHVLPSTTHRVVNPVGARVNYPRYSMPFFLHYNSDYPIATLPGCITPGRPNRYAEPILADDYLRERLREINLLY
jgi:isopenicillin N synthase-like dioxygenase